MSAPQHSSEIRVMHSGGVRIRIELDRERRAEQSRADNTSLKPS